MSGVMRARAPAVGRTHRRSNAARFPLRGATVAAAAALFWLLSPAPASAQGAGAALRAMEDAAGRYRGVSAMCADFEQVIQVRLLGREVESEGRVCQQRPNLFSMRFTDPQGDMVISDGAHFWVYYPSIDEEQVMRHPAADTPGRHDFFREFLEDPASKYTAADGGYRAGERPGVPRRIPDTGGRRVLPRRSPLAGRGKPPHPAARAA